MLIFFFSYDKFHKYFCFQEFEVLSSLCYEYNFVFLFCDNQLFQFVYSASFIFVSGERYTVGVGKITQEDVVKREIIHQLCITSMAHSELVKALPEDVSELFLFIYLFLNFNVSDSSI